MQFSEETLNKILNSGVTLNIKAYLWLLIKINIKKETVILRAVLLRHFSSLFSDFPEYSINRAVGIHKRRRDQRAVIHLIINNLLETAVLD